MLQNFEPVRLYLEDRSRLKKKTIKWKERKKIGNQHCLSFRKDGCAAVVLVLVPKVVNKRDGSLTNIGR